MCCVKRAAFQNDFMKLNNGADDNDSVMYSHREDRTPIVQSATGSSMGDVPNLTSEMVGLRKCPLVGVVIAV